MAHNETIKFRENLLKNINSLYKEPNDINDVNIDNIIC